MIHKWHEKEIHVGESFCEGFMPFGIRESGYWKFGYLDMTGNVIIPAQFNKALQFSEGLAPVRIANK